MVLVIRKYLIFVSLLVCSSYYSQEYNFWNYTVQNGLIGSKTTSILQDNHGYLWIGTESGLSKFDGATFTNYDKFDNLSNNHITNLYQDSSSTLWIGHSNGDISSYNDKNFSSIILGSDSINSFSKSISGNPVIITKKEIFEISNNQKHALPFFNSSDKEFFINAFEYKKNKWVVITNINIYQYVITNNLPKQTNKTRLPIEIFYATAFNNNYFVSSKNGTISLIDESLKLLSQTKLNTQVNSINSVKNSLFVSTKTGIFKVTINNNQFSISKNISIKNGLVQNDISNTYLDKENTLWIATKENGLLALPENHFPLYKQSTNTGKLVSYSMTNNGNTYVTYEHAISLLTYNENKIESNIVYQAKNGKVLNCAFITNTNEIWYGTNQGLYLKFANSSIEYEFKELKNQKVNDIRQIKNGNILIATDKTIYVYKPSSNKTTSFLAEKRMPAFSVKSFVKIKNILYGLGKGNILKIEDNEVTFLFNFSDVQVRELDFTSIFKDNHGSLWIGSRGKGIFKYQNKSSYSNILESLNTPYKYINSLTVKDSVLWLTTKLGIVRASLISGKYELYGQRYLGDVNFNSLSPITSNGNLYFFSDKGLVQVNTTLFNTNKQNELRISNFRVSGVEIPLSKNIELNFGNYPIKIDYESVNLKEKNYYQFKLEKYNANWSEATTQKSITYSNLKAGKYVFKIRTIDIKNNSLGIEKSIHFTINIPFWRTAKFYFLCIGGLIIFIIALYFFRIISLRKKKKKLEKQVEQKTFQLSLQKKQLEQFSYSLSHDLKNPVNNIKGLVEILQDNKSDEVINMLSESTEVLEEKLLSALDSIKRTQANTQEIKQVSFPIVFENVKKSLLMLIKKNGASISVDFSVETIQYEESLIESILYNLISNAIKYKHPEREPKIEVFTEQINDLVRLTVSDNGLGLDLAKEKDNIFSIFKRVHTNAEGSGIGLYMIKQMVEINGGSIDVESEPNLGTTFRVYLKNLNTK